MRRLIPSGLKLRIRLLKRNFHDRLSRQSHQLISRKNLIAFDRTLQFQPQIKIDQSILATSYSDNKKHNLSLAIQKIQNIELPPGAIFSFWHLVGNPSRKNGYVEGRTIVGDRLQAVVGGGLCQLSGLLYFLALKAGLEILERHPHSKDIYTEETRFAPLGSDATVVFAYKDLRFRNTLSTPICFKFDLQDQQIVAALCSLEPIAELQVEFKQERVAAGAKVDTIRFSKDGALKLLNSTVYPRLQPD